MKQCERNAQFLLVLRGIITDLVWPGLLRRARNGIFIVTTPQPETDRHCIDGRLVFFIKFSAGIKLKAFHFGSLRATQDSFLRILSRRQQNNPNAHQKRCLRGRVIDNCNNDSAIQPVSWSDATKPTSQSAAVLPVQQRSRSSGNNVIILLFISVCCVQ